MTLRPGDVGSDMCGTSDTRSLAVAEVKVNGAHRKQTLQQAFYGAWYVYRQLILRAFAKAKSTSDISGIKHYCIGMSDDIFECWEYTPWKKPEARADSLRVKAQLLCKGSMRDKVYA